MILLGRGQGHADPVPDPGRGQGREGAPGLAAGGAGAVAVAATAEGQSGWTNTARPPALTTELSWKTSAAGCPGRTSRYILVFRFDG